MNMPRLMGSKTEKVETRFYTVVVSPSPQEDNGNNGYWRATYRQGTGYNSNHITLVWQGRGGESERMEAQFSEADMRNLAEFAGQVAWAIRVRDQGDPVGSFICKNCVDGTAVCLECKGTGRTP
jgi:hypothetical protein